MKLFRGFAFASAILAFAIAVLGSWVRVNGAGLTCPDWPLCRGHLVPALSGGVVLEWSHRLFAFVETFVVIGAVASGARVRNRVRGLRPALLVLAAIFALQIVLGGATVLLGNSPSSVVLHWATGMALLATLCVLAVLSVAPPQATGLRATAAGSAAPALALAAGLAFSTMCFGAYVSSSGAGLACTSVPLCGAAPFGTTAAQVAQMLHRLAAFGFAIAAGLAAVAAQKASLRVRVCAMAGVGLVVLQVALGILNVTMRLPAGLREAHAANAAATFLAFVFATAFASLERPATSNRSPKRARAIARIAPSA